MRKTARAIAAAAVLAFAILALAGCAKNGSAAGNGSVVSPDLKGVKRNSPLGVVNRLMKAGLNDDMDTFAKCFDTKTRELILSNKKYLKGKQFLRKYLFGTRNLNQKGKKTFSWELGETDDPGDGFCLVTVYVKMRNSEGGTIIGDTQFDTALFDGEWLLDSNYFCYPIKNFLADSENSYITGIL